MRFTKADFESLQKMEALLHIRQMTRVSLKDAVAVYEQVMAYGTVDVAIPEDVGDSAILIMLYVAFAYAVEALAVNRGEHVFSEFAKEWFELAEALRKCQSIQTTDRWVIDRFAKLYQDMRLPHAQYDWYKVRIFGDTASLI